MNNLFRKPTNALESLIINAEMWEIETMYVPTYFSKHSAKDVHMHRRTRQYTPEVWSPVFNQNVVDEEVESSI